MREGRWRVGLLLAPVIRIREELCGRSLAMNLVKVLYYPRGLLLTFSCFFKLYYHPFNYSYYHNPYLFSGFVAWYNMNIVCLCSFCLYYKPIISYLEFLIIKNS